MRSFMVMVDQRLPWKDSKKQNKTKYRL